MSCSYMKNINQYDDEDNEDKHDEEDKIEGFKLFEESSMNLALIFFILVVIGIAVYYFMRK